MAQFQRPSAYHKLPIAEKQALAQERLAEPPVRCPGCDVATSPVDLLPHLAERCEGAREPGPSASWVDRRTAVALGVPAQTLHYWARRGLVRTRGEPMDRKYLLRDLARRVAIRHLDRRR